MYRRVNADNEKLGDEGIITVVNSLSKLTELNAERTDISDEGVIAIANGLPLLTELNIGRIVKLNQRITWESEIKVFGRLPITSPTSYT